MTKWFFKLLAILMLVTLTTSASASALPPTHEISDNPTYSHYEWCNPSRAADFDITFVESGISVVSNGVYVSGMTMASKTVACVGGLVSIQYWEDNTWKNYTRFYFEALNASSCELSRTVSVPGGFYYRLKITHTAENGADMVSQISTTKSVYVN